jgi:hypothetical protein
MIERHPQRQWINRRNYRDVFGSMQAGKQLLTPSCVICIINHDQMWTFNMWNFVEPAVTHD